jgi:hypothetical protein
VRLDENEICISGPRRTDVTGVGAWSPYVENLALPKSLKRGNLTRAKAVIRGMTADDCQGFLNVARSTLQNEFIKRILKMRIVLAAIVPFILFSGSMANAACSDCTKIECSGRQIECGHKNFAAKIKCEADKSAWKAECETKKSACYKTCL